MSLTWPALGQERRAQAAWWYRAPAAEVGHYWVKTDLPADQANTLAQHLNLMHGEYATRLASLPASLGVDLPILDLSALDEPAALRALEALAPAKTTDIS